MSSRKRISNGAPDDSDRGPLLGALLRLCHQSLIAEVARDMAAAGHPAFQPSYAVVRSLWDHPDGLRATELAASARITKQSMGATLDQLEASNYIERVADPDDKRAKRVRLTKRGREASRLARAAVRRVEADWASRIGAERLAALRET